MSDAPLTNFNVTMVYVWMREGSAMAMMNVVTTLMKIIVVSD